MNLLRPMAAVAVFANLAMNSPYAQVTVNEDIGSVRGELHSVYRDGFMELVIDREKGEFLVPTYDLLAEQMIDAEQRILEAGGMPDDDDLVPSRNFRPYPDVLGAFYDSRVIAILDSGVLTQHPMITDQLHEVIDFTGTGGEDTCGHGTIQAIRHVFFEPRARLLILKIAGTSCKPTIGTIAAALEHLRSRDDVGFVYFAGGVNITETPRGQLVCDLADRLVRNTHLESGDFVSTTGNVGSLGKWCPAHAQEVVGVSVADVDTYARREGVGGLGVLQKGEDVSFPDMTAMTIPEFYREYSRIFFYGAAPEQLRLMDNFGRKGMAYEESFEEGARLVAKAAFVSGDGARGIAVLEDASRRRPESPLLAAELAAAYVVEGHLENAAREFSRAFGLFDNSSGNAFERRLEADLLAEHGRYLALVGQPARAIRQLTGAARLEPWYIVDLLAFGGQQFYRNQFSDSVEINQIVLDIDPTFAPSWYNIAISYALSGRKAEALEALEKARNMHEAFDSGTKIPSVDRIRELIIRGTAAQRQVGFTYAYGYHHTSAGRPELLREILSLSAAEIGPALQRLTVEELRSLSMASILWVDRLLGRAESDFHRRAIMLMSSLLGALDREHAAALGGRLTGRVAALYRRLKDHVRAQAWFEDQAGLLRSVSIRERERALLEAGRSALTIGDVAKAEELIEDARSTSTEISADPEFGIFTTTMVSEIMSTLAFLATLRGEHVEAQELVYGGYMKDRHSIFNLLALASISVRIGQEELADEALAAMLRQIKDDKDKLNLMYRMFDDYPFLDTTYDNGQSVLEVVRIADRLVQRRAVELVPDTEFPLHHLIDFDKSRWLFPFGPCSTGTTDPREPTVAVLGTGLLIEHPCLSSRIGDSFDFTDSDPWDRNGATTAQALQLGNYGRLINVKVLDESGYGSVKSLIRGFAQIIVSDAELVMTHIQTDVEDSHLLGLVRRASEKAIIFAIEPSIGSGLVFPISVHDLLQIVS